MPAQPQTYVPGVHAARALAVTMVVVAHMNGLWVNAEGFNWFFWQDYQGLVMNTLRFDDQGGAHVGLLLFFLVSGYIVSQAADRESRAEFAVKRIARLVPAMVLAVAFTMAVGAIGEAQDWTPITGFNSDQAFSARSLLEALGLGITFSGATAVLFPLWTLTVEYYWYALLGASIGPARRRPVLATVVIALCVLVLTQLAEHLDGPIYIGSVYLVFVILVGRWIYLLDRKVISLPTAVLGSLAMIGLFTLVLWDVPGRDLIGGQFPRLLSIAWAVALFCVLLKLVKHGPWRPVSFLADISYGLYLFHVPVMFLVFPIVSPGGRWFPLGLAMALGIAVLLAWLSYRFVETPARRWARRKLQTRVSA